VSRVTPKKPKPADPVTVAYVHDIEVAYSWHASFVDMIGHDMANHGRVIRGGYMGVRYGTGGIVEARNTAARRFLSRDRSDWLFWIDTDMGFTPDTIDRLIANADPVERPVVGGLCFANREVASDGMGGFRTTAIPTIYMYGEKDGKQGFNALAEIPDDKLVRCSATGSACLLVHRSAFEAVAEKFGQHWYDPIPNPSLGPGSTISEDLAFCVRLGACDIPVHVHTGVKTTHLKPIWLSHEHFG